MSTMPVSPSPTHSVLPYQSPLDRAYSASGKTALGLVIALLIPLVSLGIKYLITGDFSHTAFVALLTAAGVAAGGVVLQFLLKLQSAIGDNTPPTVTATGDPPAAAPAPAIFAPPITAATLRDVLEVVDVLQQWQRPVAPPAAIGHRPAQGAPVTEPPADVMLGMADPPVKRSRAAKMPVVPPVDAISDH